MQFVLIIAATSDIAKALARVYAEAGYCLYLTARNSSNLQALAQDIKLRYSVQVKLKDFDSSDFASHDDFFATLDPKPFGVIAAAGYMQDQQQCQYNWQESLNTINVNFTGAVSLLNIVANDMQAKRQGFIIGISSVAGDRGRAANYIYGSAKAGFSTYLSGLRNRLFQYNVQVLTIKPGFVYTKMTQNLKLPPLLTADTQSVAKAIFKAQQNGKDVLYTKAIWQLIMLIIKLIPEYIFKRLNL